MRINVYSQELTKEIQLVSKESDTGITYYGVRLFFDGSPRLHHTEDDDDRSAITFWIPNGETFTKNDLAKVFWAMGNLVEEAPDVPKNL